MSLNKKELRLQWHRLRQTLSSQRKIEAAEALAAARFPPGIIGSFVSFRDEINTEPLNELLSSQKKLALPRIEKDRIIFCLVDRLEQLIVSPLGMHEPSFSCPLIDTPDIILVPGLAFDKKHYRLGYGKGHYDQYLKEHRTLSIGIGFKEQLTDILPHEPHDIPLHQLLLF